MRWLWRGFAGVLCLLLVLGGVAAGLIWATLPGGDLTLDLAELNAPVSADIDADGIPRIHAANEHDAAMALGLLHARERFLQMDLTRRGTGGDLAELVGAIALPVDRMMRTLGVRRAAEADYAALPAETRSVLDAYAIGVNTWLTRRGRFTAAEYLWLGTPRPWTGVDCLLWAKAMGIYLSGNWRTELARAGMKLPEATIRALWPQGGGAGRPEASLDRGMIGRLAAVLPRFPAPFTLPESASDEWAVDGAHSATGAPLLAGDPHLALGLPAVWYLVRIDLPGRALVGASAPGVPFLLLGQNGRIAWTFTNTGADVQDLFVETPAGPDAYLTPDGPQPYTSREEHIRIRGGGEEVLQVRETRHGPVISDLAAPDGPVLAASMANLMPGDTASRGMQLLNRATTVAEAGEAATQITSPVQNLLVADARTIGFFVTGRVPVRRGGDGAMPAPGADGKSDWTGWSTALPRVVAPPGGRLANGNERVAPPDYPVFLGADWFGDWRVRRIRERLAALPKADLADFAAMQTDAVSLFARDHLAQFLATQAEGSDAQIRDLLRGWDATMRRDAPQPLIWQAWTRAAGRLLLQRLGATAGGTAPVEEMLDYALRPEGAAWCGGDCPELLGAALSEAAAELRNAYGADPARWRWGTAHPASFPHPLLRFVPVIGGLAGAAIDSDGGNDTLLRAATVGRSYDGIHGGAYRGVYDLAEPARSRFVLAPGQSGHFASSLARNFLRRWRDGDSVTIGPRAAGNVTRLILRPAP